MALVNPRCEDSEERSSSDRELEARGLAAVLLQSDTATLFTTGERLRQLGRRSASMGIAAGRRRTSFNVAAPPRASSGTTVARVGGSRRRRCRLGSKVPASVRVHDRFAPARRLALTVLCFSPSRGAFGIPLWLQLWSSGAALTIRVVAWSGSAPHNRSPNPSLQRTLPGRSPGQRR